MLTFTKPMDNELSTTQNLVAWLVLPHLQTLSLAELLGVQQEGRRHAVRPWIKSEQYHRRPLHWAPGIRGLAGC
jgi:hypothetical protein